MYHDEMNKTLAFSKPSYTIMLNALNRYIFKLNELSNSGTKIINDEIELAKSLSEKLERAILDCQDDGDVLELSMLGKYWGKIHALCTRFLSWKRQIVREQVEKTIPEALEPELQEIEDANYLNGIFEKCKVPIGDIIPVEFYGENMKNEPKAQTFRIDTFNNFNGQFVGINNGGTVTQSNQIEISIGKISDAINTSEVSDDIKQEYLADLVAVNAQLNGGKPDKGFVEKALGKLRGAIGVGGDLATITALVLPHLDKLQHLIK